MNKKTNHTLDELLVRARKVYRDPEMEEQLELPPAIAARILENEDSPKTNSLLVWQRASYLGVAAAAVVALAAAFLTNQSSVRAEQTSENPWLEMESTELSF